MKILFIKVPDNTVVDLDVLGFPVRHHQFVGIAVLGERLLQMLVPASFSVQGEDGDPPTTLPANWTLVGAYRLKGEPGYSYRRGDPVTVQPADMQDAVIDMRQRYARYFVKPVIDMTDPDNPVVTGVRLFDQVGIFIEQIDGVAPAADGSYTKTWTVPGKDTGYGVVPLDALEPDGSYIHTPIIRQLLHSAHATILTLPRAVNRQFWPDNPDGTRPTQSRDMLKYSRHGLLNRSVTEEFTEEFV